MNWSYGSGRKSPADDISKIPKQTGLYALSENGTYRYVGIYYDRLDKDPRPAGSIRKPAG
jgi:hypothetical protein